MYRTNDQIIERSKNPIQTIANNSDFRANVSIVRNRTELRYQRHWERTLISTSVGTRNSITVKRPAYEELGTEVFLAQIHNNNAIIRHADVEYLIDKMIWKDLKTIENVTDISLCYDGYMVQHGENIEFYTVNNYPYVFHIRSGILYCENLNTDEIVEIASGANKVTSIRGLYSSGIGLDDGVLFFYINNSGQLFEGNITGDFKVGSISEITMKPAGVLSWSDVAAGRTFDWRISLQLKDNNGNVYTLLSKSRASGFSNNEHVNLNKVVLSGRFSHVPPVPILASNISYGGNYGIIVSITFDMPIYTIPSNAYKAFSMTDLHGKEWPSTQVSRGSNNRTIYVWFDDFNSLPPPLTLKYSGYPALLGDGEGNVDAFDIQIKVQNLDPRQSKEYVQLSDVTLTGEFLEYQTGVGYLGEYVSLSSVALDGDFIELQFISVETFTQHIELSDIKLAGNFYHIDDIPT